MTMQMALRDERKIGREEGRRKGRHEGRMEGALAVAKNMFTAGFPLTQIATLTGLNMDELSELGKI